ncbi:MAG: FtsX-like permease family protein, partial [Verrucomicrobiales bacterium]|nr:FtsX-like permease family protein [Verrucomicrobiales bacterium]
MSRFRLIFRSLQFHFRSNLGALIGAAISTAILVGALTVGDSVRQSLLQMALARLGRINLALASNDRFFQEDLSKRVQTNADGVFASAIQISGTAAAADGSARANKVQVIGVHPDFWKVSVGANNAAEIPSDTVFLNQALAEQLRVKEDATVLIRVPKPSDLSRDAPLSPVDNSSTALRLRVGKVVSEDQLGRFSLQASQIPPFNAFVSMKFLQQKLAVTNRANLVVAEVRDKAAADLLKTAKTGLLNAWQL